MGVALLITPSYFPALIKCRIWSNYLSFHYSLNPASLIWDHANLGKYRYENLRSTNFRTPKSASE